VIAKRSEREHVNFPGGAMGIQELARYYLAEGKTVRAAALMMKLVATEPTDENLTLLADIYMQQGLFDDAKELYLRVVKAGLM
jgi:tetratricopeptide (TPR) repeat protein